MFRYRNSTLFNKGNISDIIEKAYNTARTYIKSESDNYILNVNEVEYADHLESKIKLNVPEIHFDQIFADSYEADVPAEYFPNSFHRYEGKSYIKEIIQYFIPVSGDISLLNYRPASVRYIGGVGGNFEIKGKELVTEIVNFSNDANIIRQTFEQEKEGVFNNYHALIYDINLFNSTLKAFILSVIKEKKDSILSKESLLSSLGVPLKKKVGVPMTFAVPKPNLREKIVITKPIVTDKAFRPEPTLDERTYGSILKLINDVGKNFERMPSLYKDKGEEDLRDHILMVLDPNFVLGSATGETFNKSGKTDIQLRYDSSVVFIAECKIWAGEKKYITTIDQLLGYLTWRDTKASIIVFVRQKDFTSILNKIKIITGSHANYLGYVKNNDENWFDFRIHINGDKNREVKLAVQLFHLP